MIFKELYKVNFTPPHSQATTLFSAKARYHGTSTVLFCFHATSGEHRGMLPSISKLVTVSPTPLRPLTWSTALRTLSAQPLEAMRTCTSTQS